MITMYVSRINRKPMYTQLLIKDKDKKESIIKEYTSQMIGYWKMILFRTTLGREMSSLFSFKAFVPACLYIMKSGIVMNGVYIIEKSRYLESALPEANTLDVPYFKAVVYTNKKQHFKGN